MNNSKVRIYDLSRELNLENKDLLEICEQLSIPFKSHSSTITETEAEAIRQAAPKYAAEHQAKIKSGHPPKHEKGEKKPTGLITNKPNQPQKQQIVEIKHNAPTEVEIKPNQPQTLVKPQLPSEVMQTETLTPPVNSVELEEQTKQVIATSPQKQEQQNSEYSSPNQSNDRIKPQLKTAESESVNRNGATTAIEKPIPRKNKEQWQKEKENRGIQKDRDKEPRSTLPRKNNNSAPTTTTTAGIQDIQRPQKRDKDKAVSIAPVLREPPKKPTPPRKQSSLEDELGYMGAEETPNKPSRLPTDITEEEDFTPAVELLELRKPNPPKQAKNKKNWGEEEEEEIPGKSKTSKVGKRKPLIIDEDDDDFASDLEELPEAVVVSLSIARPPKPKRSGAIATTATANKTKKPTVKNSETETKEKRKEQQQVEKPESIILTGSVTVRELAEQLKMPETEIIKKLFFKGMAVSITQSLDLETAKTVAEEFEVIVLTEAEKSIAIKETEMLDIEDMEKLQKRPPVVTIMGHVDHGKTSLLDAIRQTRVAQGEAGGITQHIGAYHVEIEHNGKEEKIVFLDTPGHEAFTAMRARGARVTDIAVLVVAADDGVQPQTIEAISHAKAAEVPIIVAINKIDKAEAQPDRVKQELTEYNLVSEEWGGDTIMVPVSAIQKQNLDTLLEMILLVAEVGELQANPDRLAKGTVIEAHLDKAKGPVATLLVQNGTLKVGDTLVAGSVFAKVRAMVDDRGNRVESIGPSFPVEILGLSEVPSAGDEFEVFPTEKEAKAIANERSEQQRQSRLQQLMASRRVSLNTLSQKAKEGELKELNLILKADVQGSLEAILNSLQQLPQNEVQVRVLFSAPGEVTQTDVDLAAASGAVIVGFNTTLASGARQAADESAVDIREYNIIYNLLDDIQAAMEGLLEPELVEDALGQVQVRAVFSVGKGTVAGCYVLSGKAVRNCRLRVKRNGKVVYEGILDSLKRMREDVKEVNTGFECGVGIDKFNDWQDGDIIETYQMITKRRTLSQDK